MSRRGICFAAMAMLAAITPAWAATGTGPFTLAQATAGRTAFLINCTNCHGAYMNGGGSAPALTGVNFMEDFGDKTAKQLFQFASENMPFNFAGMLSHETYLNIVSYILAVNGARPGAVPFTGDSPIRINTIADGRPVAALLNGEGAYAFQLHPTPAPVTAKPPAKKRP